MQDGRSQRTISEPVFYLRAPPSDDSPGFPHNAVQFPLGVGVRVSILDSNREYKHQDKYQQLLFTQTEESLLGLLDD